MNYTTNYNLKKPEGSDFYDVSDENYNSDIIDTELKKAETHRGNTSNPHGVTKSQVGLGNVPNVATNDQTPTFTQASSFANISSGEKLSTLFGKVMRSIAELITHKADTGNPHSVTKSQVGLGNVDNTSDTNKPVSTATQTALNAKQEKHITRTATLSTSGWSNKQQTVSVTSVTSSNTVFTSPAPASYAKYGECGVRCKAQGSGTLTFTCEDVPTTSLTVNVMILGV